MYLEAELTEHLGYEKYSPEGKNSGNSRNGKTRKTIMRDSGEIELEVPRDRNGTFEPIVVQKYERTLEPIEDKIISMYAKGMTTRDIQSHIHDFYGLDISATLVSQITDKVIDLAKEWHNRPFGEVYPIVYFDAISYKVRNEGKIINKVVSALYNTSDKKYSSLCCKQITKITYKRIRRGLYSSD